MSTITAKTREGKQRSKLTELRNKGFIPGVVYGYQTEATSIAVQEKELLKTLKEAGRNGVLDLNVEGNSVKVVLNEYQQDKLKGNITHADFLAVSMSQEIEMTVTVVPVGDSAGVRAGGILEQPNYELKIKVKPNEAPNVLEVDVTELQIGETIKVEDVRNKVNYHILDDDDYTLVTVTAPRVAEETEADEESQEETKE